MNIKFNAYNMVGAAVLTVLTALCLAPAAAEGRWGEERVRREVSHDARALVVDGARRMLFAGEIHYTRSTPEVTVCSCFDANVQVFPLAFPTVLNPYGWLKALIVVRFSVSSDTVLSEKDPAKETSAEA